MKSGDGCVLAPHPIGEAISLSERVLPSRTHHIGVSVLSSVSGWCTVAASVSSCRLSRLAAWSVCVCVMSSSPAAAVSDSSVKLESVSQRPAAYLHAPW